jgi:hypothetical protein
MGLSDSRKGSNVLIKRRLTPGFEVAKWQNERGYGIYDYKQAYRKTTKVQGPESHSLTIRKGNQIVFGVNLTRMVVVLFTVGAGGGRSYGYVRTTPRETSLDGKSIWAEKKLAQI